MEKLLPPKPEDKKPSEEEEKKPSAFDDIGKPLDWVPNSTVSMYDDDEEFNVPGPLISGLKKEEPKKEKENK